jgi:hypothetical protein
MVIPDETKEAQISRRYVKVGDIKEYRFFNYEPEPISQVQ